MKKTQSRHAASGKRTSDIIQAALACFTELGFNNTSMADICTRANASTGSVYHHFKSKELLAAAVYLEGIETYQSGLLEIFKKEKDPYDGISSVIEYHLKWVQNNPDWAQFLFQKRHSSFLVETENALITLNKKFKQGIEGWFKHHIKAGKIRPLAWDVIISLLLGPCQEYTKLYMSKKTVTKIDEAVHELSLAAWSSLAQEQ
ncbi:MAG: TetR/AcrR family transcriptional regulator [Deltaproteobacteria bacterium HGW-Deltaproteobacteria-10]|nr:MAG: TetR/AcrR family transcriptional regulator [Deltaproteobacteria bacterium HGW-Deltaproteobacteria-10]